MTTKSNNKNNSMKAKATAKSAQIEGSTPAVKTVNHRVIQRGKTYQIKERLTGVEDDVLLAHGRRKSLSVEGADLSPLPYNEFAKKYDLGLDETSVDFINMSKSEVDSILKENKYVIECYERFFGKNFLKECVEDNSAFSSYVIEYSNNKLLQTDNFQDVVMLYQMLRSNKVCFKEEERDEKYEKYATYTISCIEETVSEREATAKEKYDLREWFTKLSVSDSKSRIVAILKYLDENVSDKTPIHILNEVWSKRVDTPSDRVKMTALYNNINGELEMIENLDIVERLMVRGIIVSTNAGVFSFDGKDLGKDKQDILDVFSKNEELFNKAKSKL